MKILLVITLISFTATLGHAETSDAIKPNAGTQADRGLRNILFGWTDIPRSIAKVTIDTRNPVWGVAAGTFSGIGTAFQRTASGIADIVTLPAAHCDDRLVKPSELNKQIR